MDKYNILITGTSRGIGRELALYYISLGHFVIGCSRSESSIQNDSYKHCILDITDEKSVISVVRKIKQDYGKIDVLINNAGIASMNHIITTSFGSVQNIFATNFFGTFLLTREVSKVMMKAKFGKIVNFTTVASPLYLEGEAIYAASKSAIESFTKTTAKELSSFGITINAIGPTPVKTDLIKAVPQNKIDELLQKQAIKRFGEIDDIKNVIDFFISKKSDFITGQIIYLGGV
jgi:3-oxoacyl-[acyl-carrier protein] reductase